MNKTIFCVYFDKGFLLKGLAMYASFMKTAPEAELWILALDVYTEKILRRMNLPRVKVISMSDFEDKELLAVKKTRSPVEYFWTCSPSLPLYIFKQRPNIKYVVYLDGDLYFFSSALKAAKEIDNKSLLVVEHRFPKGQEILAKRNGRFNLAFNVFRNDKEGIKCLKRWRGQCLDWCYWKPEDGKMGDQGYLDEWPSLYKNLVISKNLGLDVAPWNVSQYKITKKGNTVNINNDALVCYHFHQFQVLGPNNFNRVLGYTLPKNAIEYIYKPYEKEIEKQFKFVRKFDKNFKIEAPHIKKTKFVKQAVAKYMGPLIWRFESFLETFNSQKDE